MNTLIAYLSGVVSGAVLAWWAIEAWRMRTSTRGWSRRFAPPAHIHEFPTREELRFVREAIESEYAAWTLASMRGRAVFLARQLEQALETGASWSAPTVTDQDVLAVCQAQAVARVPAELRGKLQ